MRRMICCASLFVFVGSTFLSAQETVQPRKQRVSPKLLRQAMALPEYQAQAPDGKPALKVDDVAKLAEKLRKDGDTENAALLQQFIAAHQQLTKHVGIQSTTNNDPIELELQVVEVNEAEVPESSLLRGSSLIDLSGEKRSELNRLLAAGAATILVTPISFETTTNQAIRLSSTCDGTSARLTHIHSTTPTNSKTGLTLEVLASSSETRNLKLQTTCEIHHDSRNSLKQDPPSVQKVQITIDANFGDTLILTTPSTKSGQLNFVVLTPARKS